MILALGQIDLSIADILQGDDAGAQLLFHRDEPCLLTLGLGGQRAHIFCVVLVGKAGGSVALHDDAHLQVCHLILGHLDGVPAFQTVGGDALPLQIGDDGGHITGIHTLLCFHPISA